MDALTVKGLSKTYSSFTLQNISFQVPKGTIVGLVGENGAGKSTTINAVLGLIKKDSGDISILGRHDYEMTAADRELLSLIHILYEGIERIARMGIPNICRIRVFIVIRNSASTYVKSNFALHVGKQESNIRAIAEIIPRLPMSYKGSPVPGRSGSRLADYSLKACHLHSS